MGLDLKELLDREFVNPDTLTDAPLFMRQAIQTLIDASAAESIVAEAGGAAEVATVASLLAETVVMVPLIMLMILTVLLLNFLENKLATAVSRVPWVGHPLELWIHFSFNPPKFIVNALYSLIDHVVPHLWDDLVTVVGAFASWAFTKPTTTAQGATSAQAHQLQLEINATNARVDALNTLITNQNHFVFNSPAPTLPAGIVTLPEQLHKVQADLQTLYDNQSHFYTELQHIVTNLNKLDHDVQQLEKALIGTRTEQLGVQDTLNSMHDTIAATQQIETQLSGEIQQNTRSIAVLNPLSILLEPGIPGLNNLRKLEDDPCQCPKFKGIPNETGTELAVELAVAHGV